MFNTDKLTLSLVRPVLPALLFLLFPWVTMMMLNFYNNNILLLSNSPLARERGRICGQWSVNVDSFILWL